MTWKQLIIFSLLASIVGCTGTRSLTQAELRLDKDHDITVRTKDGRTIIFHAGDYKIIDDNYGSLQGKGRLLVDERRNDYREWQGSIAFAEIASITDSQTTILGYGLLGISAVALLMLFALSTVRIHHI